MFLGVDGGGTKTALCLVTDDGHLAATLQAPSCYYLGRPEGTSLVDHVLRDAVGTVCERAGITPADVAYGFFGLASYGEVGADVPALDAAPRGALGHDRYACDNDMVAGWAGSLGAADGINVVAGTGSICYGVRAGQHVRVGGWGELFGDEGSGHWIGLRGLQAFTQMCDGRLAPGPLVGVMREHFPLAADLDVITITMQQWHSDRRRVAALSTVVDRAAERGDEHARTILSEAAHELVRLVSTARDRLGFATDERVVVSHSGGVFSSPRVKSELVRRLASTQSPYDFREPQLSPVVGAALYAARLAGTPLAEAALARLRADA